MANTKLIRKKVGVKELDTIKYRKSKLDHKQKDPLLLEHANRVWNSMEDYRQQNARGYRMVYGDQWADLVTVYMDGEETTMTMRKYMEMQGNIPMQANQLKTQVNTISGVLIKEQNEPVCNAVDRAEQQYGELMTMCLQANCNRDHINTIYQSCTRDVVIGGLAVVKENWGYRNNDSRRADSWTQYIDPNYLILETTFRDPNMEDIDLIGCWWKMSRKKLNAMFSKYGREVMDRIEQAYGPYDVFASGVTSQLTDQKNIDNLSFMKSTKPDEVCVAEIWTYETKERLHVHDWNEGTEEYIDADDTEMLREINAINNERKALARESGWSAEEAPFIEVEPFTDSFWYCRYLAPDGTIIYEEESQAPDRMHPFTVIITPFNDGRIVGWMSDAYDLQIALNRTYVLQDWIARNQVKGITMVPKSLIPEHMSNETFIRNSLVMGNYFVFDDKELPPGTKIETIYPSAVSYDASNLMAQIKTLMEGSTAVSSALQGKTPYSGTSAALYAQQTLNASTPLASLLSDIRAFMEKVSTKKVKNIAAFYDPERFEKIAGAMSEVFDNANMNFNEVKDIEFDLVIKESSETPVYRAITNDTLLQFFQMGAIDLETMLSVGSFPFADQLLQKIQARQAEVEAAQQSQASAGMDPKVEEEVSEQSQAQPYGIVPEHATRPLVK